MEAPTLTDLPIRFPTEARIGPQTATWHLLWFAGISAASFLVPFLLTSVWHLHHDIYYLVYFAVSLSILAAYVRRSGFSIADQMRRRWRSSLAIGIAAAGLVVWSVLARIDATLRPTGLYFAFEFFWRGAVYGVVDALLLSAFPGLVALGLMRSDISGWLRRAAYGALTLVLSVIITVAYHVGYDDFRNKDVIGPVFGNAIISIPVIATANPLGSIVAHAAMHLAAVTNSYESKDRLPPQVFTNRTRQRD